MCQKFEKFLSITKIKDSQGLDECKISANEGGNIAKRAREDLEKHLDKTIISDDNFLPKNKQKNIIKKNTKLN